MRPAGSVGSRAGRWDPWGPVCALVALAVYLPHGFAGELTRDLGVYTYAGQQFADGVPPYVAILNRAGPLAHVFPGLGALGARMVGADEIVGMRLLFLLLSVASIWVAYLLGRTLFASRLAGVACAAAMLSFEGFAHYAAYGPREKTTMVLFLLCCLLAVAHRRWATAGVFIALATLTWQPVFFTALPAAVTAVLMGEPGGRWRALLRIGVGGLVPTAVAVAVYAALGHLRIFLESFLLINARYTDQASEILEDRERFWSWMAEGYGWSQWVLAIGSLALLAASIRALVRPADRRTAGTAALVGTAVALLCGVAWSLRAFNGWPDAFPLLPCAAVGIGACAAAAREVSARTAVAVTAAWAVAAVSLSVVHSVTERNTILHEQEADVRTVLDHLPPGSTIFSVDSPQALVLSGQTQPVRHQLFTAGLADYVDDTWPGGLDGYGGWIGRQAPTVIAMGLATVPTWLTPTLDDYAKVGHTTGWAWYVRRDLGAPTRHALRDALRGVPEA